MRKSITLAPPNSLILILDYSFGELPEDMEGGLVAFTSSCVAVGTLSEFDGDTTVTMTSTMEGSVPGELVFDGIIEAPQRELSVCNVRNERLLTMPLLEIRAHVQIFANDASEPDEIVILVGDCEPLNEE